MAPARKKAKANAPWEVHPGVEMVRKLREGLEEKTGRTLAQWLAIVRKEGPEGARPRRMWLRKEHGLSSPTAWWIAAKAGETGPSWDDDPGVYLASASGYVDALFGVPGTPRRDLFDHVVARARALGEDVRVCPCQTMVPLYRKYVFAELHPTAAGVALALALPGGKAKGRLQKEPQSAGNRVGHRVLLASKGDLDAEVDRWLSAAYAAGDRTKSRPAPKDVAPDLAAALKGSAPARKTWESMTPRMRADFTTWIEDAKKADTRTRRVARCMERLVAGKRSLY